MSRVGKVPISIADAVTVSVTDGEVLVEGPKGSFSHTVPAELTVEVSDGALSLSIAEGVSPAQARSLWGLHRALLGNMVTGVVDGFSKQLEIVGVGYRVQQKSPTALTLSVGFSHPVEFDAPEGITFEVTDNNKISVQGIDKALVGHTAARIRATRPPEPYKGKGIRYVDEYVRRKAGKSAKA